MARDWIEWHRAYDDPESSLSARLDAVIRLIRLALTDGPAGEINVLSLCGGDARDLSAATRSHARAGDVRGLVVELDPDLAARAASNLADAAPAVLVRRADAGDPASFTDSIPVDVLLLCGIFGNVSDSDIHRTIDAIPAICRTGATVIWTRGRREPDMTPTMRRWLDSVGCERIDFVSPGVGGFAVGCERFAGQTDAAALPERLFTFRTDGGTNHHG